MISNRPMIPMLTHVDNLGDLNIDMTSQEQSLETIASNTGATNNRLRDLFETTARIDENTFNTNLNAGEINSITSSLNSAVGSITDASSSNTVIGLLKSIVNKLS